MPRDLIAPSYVDSAVITLLRQAQARVQRAWIQRTPVKVLSRWPRRIFAYCASGAIAFDDEGKMLSTVSELRYRATTMLTLAVCKLTNHKCIVGFNDDYYRTKEDIDLAYEIAIELQIRNELGLVI
jgi:hypothetical protein